MDKEQIKVTDIVANAVIEGIKAEAKKEGIRMRLRGIWISMARIGDDYLEIVCDSNKKGHELSKEESDIDDSIVKFRQKMRELYPDICKEEREQEERDTAEREAEWARKRREEKEATKGG